MDEDFKNFYMILGYIAIVIIILGGIEWLI
jgi:hypothetical protein